ncbi:MAG: 6-carboxytetrahydropterin synthase QueD [Deltaproteobacteria bacterium GWA2_38_16]|nr:MAG: 6-carboxytetrahydropterin synthase QueD [Deltaproteobacteria bacterium GWA2_38_16]OGQ03532.1 MAG: 6-carboxytetrahydropterin synthase QueD [Deltaproteobacteria bacterium RIFCSPHIGHO2_02_FULL_38_15]OGQ34609.1 MAG: 6-carboxytetrahydropterin synthase QueD [Deltaproteobacteria bacterium RIFCSPLOWO2_01_FULL_38_9]OGQ59495.1 MAG: 6-carboxytetrahydropterin synthase QueD [Deltaproteobacteria bacterium RIFCSPLOWO2_12_FULL_38_8]HBQ21229.1 6-carboxytetrahydropterin synthase QueD [Deltaproteobacteria
MYDVIIKDHFSAAHQLRDCGGICENLHGHNWGVEIIVSSQKLDSIGTVVDFKIVQDKTKEILDVFDHQLLNTIPPFTDINPSAENIARVCFDQLKEKLSSYPILVKKVIIWETDHCGASFYESSHPRGSGDPL